MIASGFCHGLIFVKPAQQLERNLCPDVYGETRKASGENIERATRTVHEQSLHQVNFKQTPIKY